MSAVQAPYGAAAVAPALHGLALQLVVKHTYGASGIRGVLNLLASCKYFNTAVPAQCLATLAIDCSNTASLGAAQSLATWLARCGHLVGSLKLGFVGRGCMGSEADAVAAWAGDRARAEAALAAALQKLASAAPHLRLQLQSCAFFQAGAEIGAVLQQLPSRTLHTLELCLYISGMQSHSDASRYEAQLQHSLGHLQNLHQLKLVLLCQRPHDFVLDPLLQQLSCLTSLTSVKVFQIGSHKALHSLPASLAQLTYTKYRPDSAATPLDIRHLTSLTALCSRECAQIGSDPQLPTSLVSLSFSPVWTMGVVWPLCNLQDLRLEFHDTHPTASETQRLANLSKLTNLALHCPLDAMRTWATSAAVGTWSSVPLRSLSLLGAYSHSITSDSVQFLSLLTNLTRLVMGTCAFEDNTSHDFGVQLAKLTQLKELELHRVKWECADDHHEQPGEDVTAALKEMPSLRSLTIGEMNLSPAAADNLATIGPQLTMLELLGCSLADASLRTVRLECPYVHC